MTKPGARLRASFPVPNCKRSTVAARNGGTRDPQGSRVSVLVFGDKRAGYANYGQRARSLHFERDLRLYLRPVGWASAAGSPPPGAIWCRAAEEHGDLGALRQRPGDGVLPRARRPHGGALLQKFGPKSPTKSPSPDQPANLRLSMIFAETGTHRIMLGFSLSPALRV
jgi:hypothetical protein